MAKIVLEELSKELKSIKVVFFLLLYLESRFLSVTYFTAANLV